MILQPTSTPGSAPAHDVERVRAEFPALGLQVYGKPLVYLDSAASAQKPRAVLDAVIRCYRESYANVHRGVHYLSVRATEAYEEARQKVHRFLGAAAAGEIVFVRGTTEAINLVAATWGRGHVGPGDEILLTTMEHHSNIVPWQLLCEERGARLRVAPIDDRGEIDLEAFAGLLTERTRLVATLHVSNVLGTVNPIGEIVRLAHDAGARVLIDGAQAAPHLPIDVRALDCDFYTISGHKMFGPSGIGALYGKAELLADMPPYQGGGEMIRSVTFEKSEFAPPPARFEAGTPNIVGAVGLGAAVDFLTALDLAAVGRHEEALTAYAIERLGRVRGLRLIGTATERVGVLSFVLDGIHPHDAGTVLDREGIAVRTGHHCAQPLMDRFDVPATVRASLALYNDRDDVDRLLAALDRVHEVLG